MKRSFSCFLCLSLLLTGCTRGRGLYASYRDVEQLQLIRTMGIDRTGEGIHLTVSSGRVGDQESLLLGHSAPTLSEAIDTLQHFAASRELFYDHADYLLLGEAAAREGIGDYLGYIERSAQLPMSINLLLVRSSSAEALMTGSGRGDYDISDVLQTLDQVISRHGEACIFGCTETARALSERGAALICAVSDAETQDTVYQQDDVQRTAVPDGFGILADGKLVDYLSAKEAVAACILLRRSNMTDISTDDGDGGTITFCLDKFQQRISPCYEDGALTGADLTIACDAKIIEMSQPHDVTDEAFQASVCQSLSRELTQRLESVLEREQRLQADFLALGPAIRARAARRYDLAVSDFREILPDLSFSVTVSVRLARNAELRSSVGLTGEEASPHA